MGAPPGLDGDLAQAFGALLGARLRGFIRTLRVSHERIHRQHDGEIDCGGNDHERHNRVDEVAEKKLAAMNCETDR